LLKNCTFIANKAVGGGTEAEKGYAGAIGLVYKNDQGVTSPIQDSIITLQ
jgi:hypothetical protein